MKKNVQLALCTGLFLTAASGVHAAVWRPVGTLVCTTIEAGRRASPQALTCNFDRLTGKDVGLTGKIHLVGPDAVPAGKRVMVWSVLSTLESPSDRSLAGQYVEGANGELRGGADQAILLRPNAATQKSTQKSSRDQSRTVVRLTLSATKA